MTYESRRPMLAVLAGVGFAAASLSGCAKPEQDTVVAESGAPLPPYPAWAQPMIGKLVSQVVDGHGQCKGAFDVITTKHVAAKPGLEAEGWGWDMAAKQPVQRVLFVNANDRIVGAAVGGGKRPDVSQAQADITSSFTGWRGAMGVTSGAIAAVGVTAHNGACNIGSKTISPDGYS